MTWVKKSCWELLTTKHSNSQYCLIIFFPLNDNWKRFYLSRNFSRLFQRFNVIAVYSQWRIQTAKEWKAFCNYRQRVTNELSRPAWMKSGTLKSVLEIFHETIATLNNYRQVWLKMHKQVGRVSNLKIQNFADKLR